MPKAVEKALRKKGRAKGYKGDRLDNFVYGTMTNMAKEGKIHWSRPRKRK